MCYMDGSRFPHGKGTKTAEAIVMRFGLLARTGRRNHESDGVQFPHDKGQFWGKGSPIEKYRDFLL